MEILDERYVDVLLDFYKNPNTITFDDMFKHKSKDEIIHLMEEHYLKDKQVSSTQAFISPTPLGINYLAALRASEEVTIKADKRWKHTRLIAWISIGISIIAIIASIIMPFILKTIGNGS